MAGDEQAPAEVEAVNPAQEAAKAAEAPHVTSIDPNDVAAGEDPVEFDERTGLPKVLRSYVVIAEPRVSIIPNFVSDAEVDHLIELSKDYWVPSVVGSGVYKTNNESKDLINKPSPNRTSYSCMLKSAHTPMVRSIEHRLAHLAGLDVDYLERLNMVRYAPGQFFNVHHDGRFRPKTVFIYLNDLPEGDGGETFFPELGAKVVPRKGCAVMWSNMTEAGEEDKRVYHVGLPPKSAMKFGINCFFNRKPLKQWEDVDSDCGEAAAAAGDQPAAPPSQGCHTVDPRDLLAGDEDPAALHSFTVCRDPKVSIVPGILSKDEADLLIGMLGPEEARPAGWSAACARIEARLAAVAALPREQMEALRVSKCEPGMTPDGQVLTNGNYAERFGKRVVFLFLNNVYEGGELRFPRLGMQVKPLMGCAVVWSPAGEGGDDPAGREDRGTVHQGRPPKIGLRFTALAVFRGHAVRGAA